MSTGSNIIMVAVILAVVIPFMILVVRRMLRGELKSSGTGMLPPPSGPDIGGI